MKDSSPWPGLRWTRAVPVQQREFEPFTWSLVEALQQRGPEALPRARELFARGGGLSARHERVRRWPIGAHFAAAPGQDALLLRLAYELEEARPWRDRWPPYSIGVLLGG